MRNALQRRQGSDGPYDMLELFLAIQFGGTELSARIEWQEKESYSTNSVLYCKLTIV